MRPLNVLLAEENDDLRSLLALALREEGYAVIECRAGSELADCIDSYALTEPDEKFDLLISAVPMPGVIGMEILRGMREWPDFPPVILMTAFGDEETHEDAQGLGVAAILDKPFGIHDLLARVREVAVLHTRLHVRDRAELPKRAEGHS